MKRKLFLCLIVICILFTSCAKKEVNTGKHSSPNAPTTNGAAPNDVKVDSADKRLAGAIAGNNDTVGWLEVPNTTIDDAVLQSSDNDYYLRRDKFGADSVTGCYFADFECYTADAETLSTNLIIYGHNVRNDADMPFFTQFYLFVEDPDFARTNRTIYYSTTDTMLQYEIISVGYGKTDNILPIHANPTKNELKEILDLADERSIYNYEYDRSKVNKILTLATCSEDEAIRLIIVARLVE